MARESSHDAAVARKGNSEYLVRLEAEVWVFLMKLSHLAHGRRMDRRNSQILYSRGGEEIDRSLGKPLRIADLRNVDDVIG